MSDSEKRIVNIPSERDMYDEMALRGEDKAAKLSVLNRIAAAAVAKRDELNEEKE
jgi:hypothetical protein